MAREREIYSSDHLRISMTQKKSVNNIGYYIPASAHTELSDRDKTTGYAIIYVHTETLSPEQTT